MKTVLTAATAIALAGAFSANAQEPDVGKRLYDDFCVACHGEMGRGAGELTGLLTVEVPDLTKLSARNDGNFPMLNVIHIIDGRNGVRAHGGPMPVFGSMFSATEVLEGAGYGSVIETRGRLMSLALYLESIQG